MSGKWTNVQEMNTLSRKYHTEIQHLAESVPDFLFYEHAFCQSYSCAHTEKQSVKFQN